MKRIFDFFFMCLLVLFMVGCDGSDKDELMAQAPTEQSPVGDSGENTSDDTSTDNSDADSGEDSDDTDTGDADAGDTDTGDTDTGDTDAGDTDTGEDDGATDSGDDNDSSSGGEDPGPIAGNSVNIQVILDLVNQARAQGVSCDGTEYPPVPAVTWNQKLERAALKHSQDMEAQNYFSHTSADGRTMSDRIQAEGYSFWAAGENIAKGHPNEEAVVQGWLKSQGHCANIMNENFTQMGVGRSGDYWTQNFGKPRQ